MNQLLPWVSDEDRRLIHTHARLYACSMNGVQEGLGVTSEPCVTCTIVQWCGTPEMTGRLYELTGALRQEWHRLLATYNEDHPDNPVRLLDETLVLAMLVAGQLDKLPDAVLTPDCGDIAEYFCRYVRLIMYQTEIERRRQPQEGA